MTTGLAPSQHQQRNVEVADPEATPRLSELDFTDLYISELGHAQIRGLADADGPMTQVPADAIDDLDELHRKVVGLGQNENEFPVDHDGVRYRVSKITGQMETWYALRRLMWPIPRLKTYGFHKEVVREIGMIGSDGSATTKKGRGLLLVAGATGNGKTTTVCSVLQEYLLKFGNVAVTIEDPPELKLEGSYGAFGQCFQLKVKNGDFATPLRSTMRMNPRYILVGEIRDPDGASEALRAAISGHVVLSTIHAGKIEEAYSSLLKLVSSRLDLDLAKSMLADGLAGIVHQELKTLKSSDGSYIRKASIQTLFVGENEGIRAKLREGKPEQLGNDIQQQANKIARNESPTGRR